MEHVNDEPRLKPSGVAGPLWLLSRLLLIWDPLTLALVAPRALASLPIRGTPVAVILILRLIVAGIGIAAGLALSNVRPGALRLAQGSLVLSAATAVFVYATPYFPNSRMPGDTPFYIAAALIYYGGWLAYLMRSRRVKNTYV